MTGDLYIGNVSTGKVTLQANYGSDNALEITGDMTITATGKLDATGTNARITITGSWTDNGTGTDYGFKSEGYKC